VTGEGNGTSHVKGILMSIWIRVKKEKKGKRNGGWQTSDGITDRVEEN